MFRRRDSEEDIHGAQDASQTSSQQGSALGGSAPAPYGQDLVGSDAVDDDLVGSSDVSASAESGSAPHAPSTVFTPSAPVTMGVPEQELPTNGPADTDASAGSDDSVTQAPGTDASPAKDTENDNTAFQLGRTQPASNEADKESATASAAAATAAGSAVAPLKKFTLADHLASQRSFGTGQKVSTPAPTPTTTATRKPESSFMFDETKPEPSNDFAPNDRNSKRTLVVGLETFLKGEISNCDRVVVEGGVDANMGDVQSLVIASTGTFRGSATLENAEISGTFDGDLTVRGRLLINTTGKVTGKVTYGDIEVKRGGKLLGEIHTIDEQVENAATPMSVAALV